MKTLLVMPLAAALLCGCASTRPIEVAFPDDPHILRGMFTGTASLAIPGVQAQTLPVQLTSTATYVSATEYKISGTLTFQDVTYTFQGMGEGSAARPSARSGVRRQFLPCVGRPTSS